MKEKTIIVRSATWVLRLQALAILFSPSISFARDWPVIEPPPAARVQSVADDMKYNGVPMRIRQFSSERDVDSVLSFYRQRWGGEAKQKPVENSLGEWRIVGRQDGDYYLTVQVKRREQGGSEGFMGVSRLPSLTERPRVDLLFPRMPGSEVISDIDSNDSGKVAKTLILRNDHSVTSNASYYQSMMPGQDWKQNQSFGGPQANNTHVLYFERRKESANIAIRPTPNGGTMVVINIVSSGL